MLFLLNIWSALVHVQVSFAYLLALLVLCIYLCMLYLTDHI